MQIIRHYSLCPLRAKHAVLVLGNFDGVHRGHQKVIEEAKAIAMPQTGEILPLAVMTFVPHPVKVFAPDTPFLPLNNQLRGKCDQLQRLGVDYLFLAQFSDGFYHLQAEEFVEKVLVGSLAVAHVVVGYDFAFGYQRRGDIALLGRLAQHYGFGLTCVKPVKTGELVYSSTAIREYLQQGNLQEANKLLGYPYTLYGRAERGKQLGQKLGFPTANIPLVMTAYPALGAYVVKVRISRGVYWGVANIGRKPSIGIYNIGLEVHLLNWKGGDLYGQKLAVECLEHIRPEQRFGSLEALKQQVAEDIRYAMAYKEKKEREK